MLFLRQTCRGYVNARRRRSTGSRSTRVPIPRERSENFEMANLVPGPPQRQDCPNLQPGKRIAPVPLDVRFLADASLERLNSSPASQFCRIKL